MIERAYNLTKLMKPGKVLVLYGARRVGKTTLLNLFLAGTKLKYKLDSGDNIRTRQALSSRDFTTITEYASGYDLIAIDEAQQIPDIGMGLKIIVDQMPDIAVIATGSSSFGLAGAVGEPLTGRKTTLTLYPIAQQELSSLYNRHELRERLEEFLVFGSYPEVVTAKSRKDKIAVLDELVDSHLLKDVLTLGHFNRINDPNEPNGLNQINPPVALSRLGGNTSKTLSCGFYWNRMVYGELHRE
jgi:predicted AAA+ superfamily ATPase